MSSIYPVHQNPLISVTITHSNLSLRIPEVKFSLLEPICEIKLSLVKRLGTEVDSMKLQLKDLNENVVAEMSDDLKPLGFYGADDNFTIHCIDTNPFSITAQLEDLSQVEKYIMSDEDYDKLPVSMRKFLKNLKENNPELFTKRNIITDPDYQKAVAEHYHKGDRCEILTEHEEERNRGSVQYIGKMPDLGLGYYIGIELDEPYGMNDGSYKGVKYFSCPNKYGMFLRPNKIQVGNFPEVDPFADEDSDEIDEI